VAAKKPKPSAQTTKYDWGDGKGAIHSISKEQHAENERAKNTPIPPPPGTYDPSLDYEEDKGKRGLQALTEDTGTGQQRLTDDYEIGTAGIKTTHDRSLSDLLTARTRGGEDYNLSVSNLQRQFKNLATGQAGQQRKAGVGLGGAGAQAAAKRQQNETLERQPIDTAYKRFTDDSATQEGRIEQDWGAEGTEMGKLSLGYKRGSDDLATALRRAQEDQGEFTKATAGARQFQANQLGYTDVLTQEPKKLPTSAQTGAVTTLTAAPGLKGVKTTTRKRKGKPTIITYTASAGGP
jgi:hypothetical protein